MYEVIDIINNKSELSGSIVAVNGIFKGNDVEFFIHDIKCEEASIPIFNENMFDIMKKRIPLLGGGELLFNNRMILVGQVVLNGDELKISNLVKAVVIEEDDITFIEGL